MILLCAIGACVLLAWTFCVVVFRLRNWFVNYRGRPQDVIHFHNPFELFNPESITPLVCRRQPLTEAETRAGLLKWALVPNELNPDRPKLRPLDEILLTMHKMFPVAQHDMTPLSEWTVLRALQQIRKRVVATYKQKRYGDLATRALPRGRH